MEILEKIVFANSRTGSRERKFLTRNYSTGSKIDNNE
jgi:hypothetical protein